MVAEPWVYETMATSHGERDVEEIADLMPQIPVPVPQEMVPKVVREAD